MLEYETSVICFAELKKNIFPLGGKLSLSGRVARERRERSPSGENYKEYTPWGGKAFKHFKFAEGKTKTAAC